MPSTSNCWSCGQPGRPVPGQSWIRRCEECDVEWNSMAADTPQGRAKEHDRQFARGRQLDKIAEKFGLGNRNGFVDHATEQLRSPA